MELRDIEIFLALAEELHFGRTAQRLHVTQARVSQAIKKQERRIGAALFDRDNRNVALTPIGRQLFEDLQPMYRGLREGIERAVRTAQGMAGTLRLGMVGHNPQDLRPLFDAFKARRPACDLQIRSVDFGDPFGTLRRGEIDVALIWLPVDEPDLTVGPVVYTEPVVLALSPAHPLAGRESVSLEDLADHTVMGGARPAYWREALVPTHTPSGRPIPVGPHVSHFMEMIPVIAGGEAMSPVHLHAARYMTRSDIAYVPIHDAPLSRWALVWRTAVETDLIRALARTAEDVAPGLRR
ncbi:LysR substrate-binding domain-containing protein [Nonomuraea sp. NPDC050783]|uniref:LysR substrate-binding domain-containing protein n=1 Tax=Nonomuraea sp. NPDC050783 TaxID=3154634 RepID=UPI003466436B